MFWVSLLAIFSKFTYFLLCCLLLILSYTQEHFYFVEGVSLEMANIVFDKAVENVTKDAVKHAHLVSAALYYSQILYHLLYLLTNFYLITSFVVLLVCAKAADKATSGARHLPDLGAVASMEG
jgi:hypothetical protein